VYERCLAHLSLLNRQGFNVEYIPVLDSASMTWAYNKAMYSSSAKYKIYLHQDVFIVEPLFLHRIHQIFSSDPQIGMIGMIGGRHLPMHKQSNLCWSDCMEVYGNVFMPSVSLHYKYPMNSPYENVTVIDGLLMATQYDIPWREDIIDGFHFYDKSQSLEFNRRGLKVVVPRMDSHWVVHYCSLPDVRDYVRLRDKFYEEYS
jgi:hypothetical protein